MFHVHSRSAVLFLSLIDLLEHFIYLFIFPLEVTHYPREPFFLPFAMQNQDTVIL